MNVIVPNPREEKRSMEPNTWGLLERDEKPSTRLMEHRRVLCIGEFAPAIVWALREVGLEVNHAANIDEALHLMVAVRFDAVLVQPSIEERGDGMRLVKSVKEAKLGDNALINVLKWSYMGVPFFVLPNAFSSNFVVFWSAEDFHMADAARSSLVEVVLDSLQPELN